MKIVSVVGARPQFIKAAPVSRALRRISGCTEVLVHTGQHYDAGMSAVFFKELDIPEPDYNLEVGSGSHGEQTGAMLVGTEAVLLKEKPDWVLVYGDTNSTLAGALAAAKLRIPVAHVEAGLRSLNREMPEEINRVLTDHISDRLFCPTQAAVDHLAREGIGRGVHLVGDVMVDVLMENLATAQQKSHVLDDLQLARGAYLLATVHRPANTDTTDALARILDAFAETGEPIVFPVHPRTRRALQSWNLRVDGNVRLMDPAGYLDMLMLEKNARMILTDSGGIQKEAYVLGVPCVTMRSETEWVETVAAGWNIVVGSDRAKIVEAVRHFTPSAERPLIFGDGHASDKIVELLKQ